MTIKKDALQWFRSNIGLTEEKILASRFYTPDEAWPKQNSWWFEIPLGHLHDQKDSNIHLLCQKSPGASDFYHLKVPAEYLLSHLRDLTIQKRGTVSIFPSAEADNMFQDLRGRAQVNFSSFLVKKSYL